MSSSSTNTSGAVCRPFARSTISSNASSSPVTLIVSYSTPFSSSRSVAFSQYPQLSFV